MSLSDPLAESLKTWLDEKLPSFLTTIASNLDHETQPWEMPVIEDYVLVVAVKDYADGGTATFAIHSTDAMPYRVRGLLTEAML